jgi:hypothetical protein
MERSESVETGMTMVKTQTRSPHGDNRRKIGRGSELERDHSMNAAELAAALALPEQHPCTGIHNIAPRSTTSSMLTSGSFLDVRSRTNVRRTHACRCILQRNE